MIYICFQSGTSFIQRAIRWFTDSDVHHVAIEYEDPYLGINWIMEADAKRGVVVRPKGNSKYKYRFQLFGVQEQNILPYLRKTIESNTGKPYDFAGILGFASFKIWWKLLKLRVAHPAHNTPGILCSELVAIFLKNFIELDNAQWQSPADILRLCREKKDLFVETEC